MSTEEPELLDQTAELLGSGGTIDLEQLQALHAAAQDTARSAHSSPEGTPSKDERCPSSEAV